MKDFEEEYQSRIKEIEEKLHEPERSKKIDAFLSELCKELKGDFRLVFDVYPETQEYADQLEVNPPIIPRDAPTMTLGEFISYIDREDHNTKVYFDGIYLDKGVWAINDVLTTTVDDNTMLIIPVSHNNKLKLK